MNVLSFIGEGSSRRLCWANGAAEMWDERSNRLHVSRSRIETVQIQESNTPDNNLIDQFFSSQGVTIPADFKSGFVAIVGRPNVGKSTDEPPSFGTKTSLLLPVSTPDNTT